uniref:SGNH hydrolase-type esterase domain-containing protein n=1 Tax=Sexangularia sp. CB-2014 TaxID=1486929 RepID=A0A7S1YK09_9EUKA|mmetsp:Transcript_6674/g.21599  ORF Transcript_6674/g.21599 Transcript_6674/m.21599 type:complete len:275 (+) Transcript_6674:149-973(+)
MRHPLPPPSRSSRAKMRLAVCALVLVMLWYSVRRAGPSSLASFGTSPVDADATVAIVPSPIPPTRPLSPPRIALVGDSLTEGYTCDEFGSGRTRKGPTGTFLPYGSFIRTRHPDWTVNIFGHSGETTRQILDRLPSLVEMEPGYDAVVLLGGTNDLGERNPGACLNNLRKGAVTISSSGAVPIVLSVPPVFNGDSFQEPTWVTGNRGLVNEGLASIDGALYVDLERTILAHRKPKELYCPDGVHFTPELSQLLAMTVEDAIVVALNLGDDDDNL